MDYANFEGGTRNRLHRLERKVDFLLKGLGLTQKEEVSLSTVNPMLTEIVALLRQNRKIEAIKVYRENTGVGLAEAKMAIDKIVY